MSHSRSAPKPSSAGFFVPDPLPPPTGFLLGMGSEGSCAIEALLWRPLEQLRYLTCADFASITPRRLPPAGGEGAQAGVSDISRKEDVLGGFVFGPDPGAAAADLLRTRPELLEPALTFGIGLNLGNDSPHPLKGLVDMPIVLAGPPGDDPFHRQLYWLVHDLHAVLFTRALVCVDVVDILVSVDKCERVFFACATQPDPALAAQQAIGLLEAQGLQRNRVQGLLGVLSSDLTANLHSYDALNRVTRGWLPETAISASTVRAYPRGLDGLYRVSLYGARKTQAPRVW